MNEIRYRGKRYCQRKAVSGEARSLSASAALRKMMPFLKRIGVTRVANLTGMTRTGIPVANAVRPGLCGPSVTHGKGLTVEAAMASACGEAIERYHAFEAPPHAFPSTYRDLEKRHAVIPLERLPLSKHSLFNPDVVEYWALGWDIANQQEVAVPLSLASMAASPAALNTCSFQCTSNGFAHGSNFPEALCQALLELIERDAMACTEMPAYSRKFRFPPTRIDPGSIEYPVVKELLARLHAADFEAAIFDCTVDTEVATCKCSIAERRVESGEIYYGMGASLDPCTAMVRAITEAVQGVAVYHTGTRDVCFRDDFYYPALASTRTFLGYLEKEECRVDARKRKSEATETFEGDITVCLRKLAKVGITQVIVFDLTVPDFDGSVVKVVAPGLEGCHDFHIYTPGGRALRYMEGAQN
ncbi:MAG: YcaO-like family protein [Deltaproteobacteria bacterium]|nr:YcaO-like family protein [Deltaproteobacteria bacterium]